MIGSKLKQSRLCWPIKFWPPQDRLSWAKACQPASIFEDDAGGLSRMSQPSLVKYAKGWGRWVSFLSSYWPEALNLNPSERSTKTVVQTYVNHLRNVGNSDGTIVNRLSELAVVTAAMDATFDPRVINRNIAVLRARAKPVRSKSHIRPTNELVDLGITLMQSATYPGNIDDALAFRDGIIIAFLGFHPLRCRNLAGLHLKSNLVRHSEGFMVSFGGSETKNGVAIEFSLADCLVEPMIGYLEFWRPVLMARRGRWTKDVGDAVWVSSNGSPLGIEGISDRISMRTRDAFGKAISPHGFRDAAATTLVIADPAHIRTAAPLLGHRSLVMTEKHYVQAKGLEAQRSYLDVLKALKEQEHDD